MFIIRENKSESLKHNIHKIKELACEVMEVLEESAKDYVGEEEHYMRENARGRGRRMTSRNEDDYYDDEDDYRDMARGRGRMRGRY